MRNSNRRERLIKFIRPRAAERPKQYLPQIGSPGLGMALSLDGLTDDTLEALAARIVSDIRFNRRMRRRERLIGARPQYAIAAE